MKNKGIHHHRFDNNPLEKAFAEKWEQLNDNKLSRFLLLEYLLSENQFNPELVSDRDRLVAATVIQWLGSPIGQSFIKEVMQDVH